MSTSYSTAFTTVSERSQFLDIYPICSQLIAVIGREFIRSWNVEQADQFRSGLLERLVEDGVPRAKAEVVWKLVVQEQGKLSADSDAGSPNLFSAPKVKAAVPSRVDSVGVSCDAVNCETKENVFSFEDGRWVVTFRNKTIYPQDITGIKYLHCLISSPGRTYSPRDLYEGFGGRKVQSKADSVSQNQAVGSGVRFDSAQPEVLADNQGKRQMLARLEEIEVEVSRANQVQDSESIEKLLAERLSITEYLRKAFTPAGTGRAQEPDLVRRMKAVDIAVRRAKEKIQRAGHHDLLRHLNETIEVKVKSGCIYAPPAQLQWRTEPLEFVTPRQPR